MKDGATTDRARLAADLRAAGLKPGDIVVVHSSLRSLGRVAGGPDAVVDAFDDAVGPTGIVLYPALTFEGSMTAFCRGLSGPVVLQRGGSRNGAIPRAAGARADSRLSLHPTHPVVARGDGARIDGLFAGDQDGQGPLGTASPFYRAALAGGRIALLGVGSETNTTLHCLEELATPYIFDVNERFAIETVGPEGQRRTIAVRGYTTATPRNFQAMDPLLEAEGILTRRRAAAAELRLIDGRRLIQRGRELLADDPLLLTRRGGPLPGR